MYYGFSAVSYGRKREIIVNKSMNSHSFFENKECQYYPCHQGVEQLNCLFCYCPLYTRENCLGNPSFMEVQGKKVKICSDCTFPHKPENYEAVVELLKI